MEMGSGLNDVAAGWSVASCQAQGQRYVVLNLEKLTDQTPLSQNFQAQWSCSRATSLPGALFPVPTRYRLHITFLRSPEKELGRRASASRASQRRAAKAVHLGEQRVLGLVDAPSAPPPPSWQKVLGHYYSEISSQRWPTQGWGEEGARLTQLFGKDQKIVSKDSCRGAGN